MTAQRVTVPVPAETGVEDRLAGSLTFRHAAYLAVAAGGVTVMLLGERSAARLALGAGVALAGAAGAALRPYGEPLDRLVPAAIGFLRRGRVERRARRRAEPAPTGEGSPPLVPDSDREANPAVTRVEAATRKPRRRPPRALLGALALVVVTGAVAAIAAARWPRPVPPPARHVIVVPVPVDVLGPWEEVVDDAVDAWLDGVTGH